MVFKLQAYIEKPVNLCAPVSPVVQIFNRSFQGQEELIDVSQMRSKNLWTIDVGSRLIFSFLCKTFLHNVHTSTNRHSRSGRW